MTATIATTDIATILANAEANYVKAILAKTEAEALENVKKSGSSVAQRKASINKALAEANKQAIAAHVAALKSIPTEASALAAIGDEVSDNGLTTDQAVLAMEHVLHIKAAKDLIDAIYEATRAMVYRTMDLAFADEEFPEHTNGVIDVPETGKRFAREGAGRKAATIDNKALADAIGAELWDEISTEQVTVKRVIDEEKLAAVVADHPELLEAIRGAVVPGEWKTPRLMVRNIPPTKE